MSQVINYQQLLDNYYAKKEFPAVNLDIERAELLNNFHPDNYAESKSRLSIGVNKGDLCHQQLCDLLQANAHIDAAQLAGAKLVETEILVVGGGGAGCAAALAAHASGASVILATKLRLGDSNTVMAEGGIQASVEKDDTPQAHFNDSFLAGHKKGDPELIKQLVLDGPNVIRWLIQQGMQFDLNPFGDLLTRKAGGTSASRVVYFRDYTGLEMMRVLRESVANSKIDVWEYSPVVELLSDEFGNCAGAVVSSLKDESFVQIKAQSVILASGGLGRLHLNQFPTSNHFGATGDGLVLAYRMGAKLCDLDSFQYHPTGLAYPTHLSGTLITEGVRSAGAYLINANGERFVDELSPRDVVAAAILRECQEGRGVQLENNRQGVWLDTPGLEKRYPGIIKQRFPKLLELAARSDIDLCKVPMLIYPTLHYQNGGVKIDKNGQSSVEGLYCVGELSGGIHGRNRLMGNALLEIISFGRKAGEHAASERTRWKQNKITLEHLNIHRRDLVNHQLPMQLKSPQLFPDYANFDIRENFSGLQKVDNSKGSSK